MTDPSERARIVRQADERLAAKFDRWYMNVAPVADEETYDDSKWLDRIGELRLILFPTIKREYPVPEPPTNLRDASAPLNTELEDLDMEMRKQFPPENIDPVPYLVAHTLYDRGHRSVKRIADAVAEAYDDAQFGRIIDSVERVMGDSAADLQEAAGYAQRAFDEVQNIDGLGIQHPAIRDAQLRAANAALALSRTIGDVRGVQ